MAGLILLGLWMALIRGNQDALEAQEAQEVVLKADYVRKLTQAVS
jgi:Tfp pilus assembly protein PilO